MVLYIIKTIPIIYTLTVILENNIIFLGKDNLHLVLFDNISRLEK